MFFYHMVLVKFYCDVIVKSCLRLSTLRSKPSLINFVPFQRNKEEGRPVMVERKLHGTVDESSADW